ncbi:MAG: hypothetical protein AAF950_18420 [Pseudomonadota bacterium]
MSDYPFDTAQQLRMRELFEKNAGEEYREASDSPKLQKFEERFEGVKAKMIDHLERQSSLWIGRETRDLLLKHKGQLKPTLSPKGILQTETSPAAIARKAWQNVEARKLRRISKLNEIGNRVRMKISNHDEEPNNSQRNDMNI